MKIVDWIKKYKAEIIIALGAISSIAALIFPSNELVNAIRFYKISILLLAAFFGIYGVFIGTIFLFYKLLSMKSFSFSYLSPLIPFDKYEWKDSILRKEQKTKYRNSYITDNIIRGRNLWKLLKL